MAVAELTRVVTALAPENSAAGTTDGAAIDGSGFRSAELFVHTGAVSGSPTAVSVQVKLQESDDASTWSDIAGATATLSGANQSGSVAVHSITKRYLRAVRTVSFTGGTSPAVLNAAVVVLGDARVRPA